MSTLVLAAAGYNVPANFIVSFRPADLKPSPSAVFVDRYARERPMTGADLNEVIQRLNTGSTGICRALASYYVPGKPLGKFKYSGVRDDDPNDIIPHETRRELRGLRVIASWINHADVGDKNTFDSFVTSDGKSGYLKHYLLDFGSTLGSGNYINGPYRVGHEYVFDGAAMSKTFFSFGAWRRPWEVKGRIAFSEIGYFSSVLFDPGEWKPNYPNLAFVRMDDGDAFWGTKIVLGFSDTLIEQIAGEGRYSREDAARHLIATLKQRRDVIGRHWLGPITPLDAFRLVESRLVFRDLAVDYGYAEPSLDRYRCRVLNAEGRPGPGDLPVDASGCAVPATLGPKSPADKFGRAVSGWLQLEVRGRDGKWASPVAVALGFTRDDPRMSVLGWRHGPR